MKTGLTFLKLPGADSRKTRLVLPNFPDMEKGAETRTLSAEIFEDCGIFLIVEDYAPLFSEENLFLVEMFDKTSNIWHIYSL